MDVILWKDEIKFEVFLKSSEPIFPGINTFSLSKSNDREISWPNYIDMDGGQEIARDVIIARERSSHRIVPNKNIAIIAPSSGFSSVIFNLYSIVLRILLSYFYIIFTSKKILQRFSNIFSHSSQRNTANQNFFLYVNAITSTDLRLHHL